MAVEDWHTASEDEDEALTKIRVGREAYVDAVIEEYEARKRAEELWEAYADGAADYLDGGALDNNAANEKLDRLLDDEYRVPDDVFERYLSTVEEQGWDPAPGEQEDVEERFPVLEERYDWWESRSAGVVDRERLRRLAGSSLERLDVSAEALYRFVRGRGEMEGRDGIWLSRLMERSSDDIFLLPDMSGVHYVAERNTKTVLVDGDARTHAGYRMRDGLLCVKGEAGDRFAAEMEGGTAIANRGVGRNPGSGMRGGELIVPDPGGIDVEGKGGRVAGLPRDAF